MIRLKDERKVLYIYETTTVESFLRHLQQEFLCCLCRVDRERVREKKVRSRDMLEPDLIMIIGMTDTFNQ